MIPEKKDSAKYFAWPNPSFSLGLFSQPQSRSDLKTLQVFNLIIRGVKRGERPDCRPVGSVFGRKTGVKGRYWT